MKKEIINKFHEEYKDSSLFNSWDNCEKDLTKFIGNVYDLAYQSMCRFRHGIMQ